MIQTLSEKQLFTLAIPAANQGFISFKFVFVCLFVLSFFLYLFILSGLNLSLFSSIRSYIKTQMYFCPQTHPFFLTGNGLEKQFWLGRHPSSDTIKWELWKAGLLCRFPVFPEMFGTVCYEGVVLVVWHGCPKEQWR